MGERLPTMYQKEHGNMNDLSSYGNQGNMAAPSKLAGADSRLTAIIVRLHDLAMVALNLNQSINGSRPECPVTKNVSGEGSLLGSITLIENALTEIESDMNHARSGLGDFRDKQTAPCRT